MILVAVTLCDSAPAAIAYEAARASGLSESMARDAVGRAAGRDVCGPYRGAAEIVSERTIVDRGRVLRLTQYRFTDRRRPAVAWEAGVAEPTDAVARGERT